MLAIVRPLRLAIRMFALAVLIGLLAFASTPGISKAASPHFANFYPYCPGVTKSGDIIYNGNAYNPQCVHRIGGWYIFSIDVPSACKWTYGQSSQAVWTSQGWQCTY
ncbi:MAG TPA: hypothetical protein PLD47_03950 [Aggregatilineales bacterium]|nr:hypothetical protein [Anaerolineales bacterium]HRE46855.1 hypothetical protein [Aggregatilineales bacterium]